MNKMNDLETAMPKSILPVCFEHFLLKICIFRHHFPRIKWLRPSFSEDPDNPEIHKDELPKAGQKCNDNIGWTEERAARATCSIECHRTTFLFFKCLFYIAFFLATFAMPWCCHDAAMWHWVQVLMHLGYTQISEDHVKELADSITSSLDKGPGAGPKLCWAPDGPDGWFHDLEKW